MKKFKISDGSFKPANCPTTQHSITQQCNTIGVCVFPVKALSSVLDTSHEEFARFPPTGWRRQSVLSSDRQSRGLVGYVSNMRIYCPSASKPECCCRPTRSCDQHTSCQPHSNLHNMLIINLDINLDFGSRSTGACTHTHACTHTRCC